MKLEDFSNYIGDINLEHGGTFYDPSDAQYGYVSFLEVIDLDSAAGVTDCVLVTRGTAIIDNAKQNAAALQCCGWTDKDLPADPDRRTIMLADAIKGYGFYDPDDMANLLIWQPFDETDNPPDADAWRADLVRLNDDQDLFEYLLSEGYLSEFE